VLQTPLPPGSHRCPIKHPDCEGAHLPKCPVARKRQSGIETTL
jgi:hypothetical protein